VLRRLPVTTTINKGVGEEPEGSRFFKECESPLNNLTGILLHFKGLDNKGVYYNTMFT